MRFLSPLLHHLTNPIPLHQNTGHSYPYQPRLNSMEAPQTPTTATTRSAPPPSPSSPSEPPSPPQTPCYFPSTAADGSGPAGRGGCRWGSGGLCRGGLRRVVVPDAVVQGWGLRKTRRDRWLGKEGEGLDTTSQPLDGFPSPPHTPGKQQCTPLVSNPSTSII